MTTSKLIDNNRRTHAAKVLAKTSAKNQHHDEENENDANTASMESGENSEASASNQTDIFGSLNEQYIVIREDILKLREDLAQGYDLIKDIIDSKLNIKSLLKLSK